MFPRMDGTITTASMFGVESTQGTSETLPDYARVLPPFPHFFITGTPDRHTPLPLFIFPHKHEASHLEASARDSLLRRPDPLSMEAGSLTPVAFL